MASRPHNVGIKAIEIYFPSQVRKVPKGRRLYDYVIRRLSANSSDSVWTKRSSRSSMASVKGNILLALDRRR